MRLEWKLLSTTALILWPTLARMAHISDKMIWTIIHPASCWTGMPFWVSPVIIQKNWPLLLQKLERTM